MKPKWSFTILLGVLYLAVFHLWLVVPPFWVKTSGWMTSIILGVLLIVAAKNGQFLNHWDLGIHVSVVLDIFLEGTFIRWHEHYGFYLCAAGFAVVLIGYRYWWLARQSFSLAPSGSLKESLSSNPNDSALKGQGV